MKPEIKILIVYRNASSEVQAERFIEEADVKSFPEFKNALDSFLMQFGDVTVPGTSE